MRILYCNKYNFRFSGTEAYLFETMELMRSQGHEVALFSMADERGAATVYDQYFVPHTDFKHRVGILDKCRLAFRSIYSVDARQRIARIIEEFKPDVAHVRNIYHHLSPSILWELKTRGVPVIYHLNDFKLICPSYNLVSHGTACERCRDGKFWNVVHEGCYSGGPARSAMLAAEAYFHQWIATYEKCLDLILAPSQFARDKLIENGWNRTRIEVLSHFQSCPLEKTTYPGRSAPILYFGRLSAEKGVHDLLVAMQKLGQVRLLIAGDGPERQHLETLARNLKLDNVTFVGHVTGRALETLIADSQFTIFPSRAYETFGKSILESYAQGRAVIASDLGSRRELVQHGVTGFLYRVGNIDDLARAISVLHDDPELSARMGDAGHELVRMRHSQETHLAVLEEIYRVLAGAKSTAKARRRTLPLLRAKASRSVRIAFIGGRGVVGKYSGIETYYEEVGERLVKQGHDVTVYCRTYFTPAISDYRGMRIVRLPTVRTKHLETLVHTLLSTAHACFSDYDIVHFHALGPSMLAFLPRLFGKRTITTVQGLDWKRRKWGRFARVALKLGEWSSARLPNETVVVSRTLQQYYGSQYRKQCVYVPNGTELRGAYDESRSSQTAA
jgi:glycosyltransferase involved in cell wall biosynthesis